VDLEFAARNLLNGATISVLLILLSLGLSVIYGLMKMLNMAHGEFFILGAFSVLLLMRLKIGFWLGVALAPVIMGVFGLLVYKVLFKSLYGKPTATILATWGLSMIIRQSLQITMGARPHVVENPFPGAVSLLGVQYPAYRVFIIAAGTLLILTIVWLYLRTTFGLQIRAAIHNRELTSALGINTERINTFSFVIGSALAGLAGALLAPLIPVGPLTGLSYLIKVFFVIIVGGAGSLIGTVVGGLVIGGGESLLQLFLSPLGAEIAILVLAVVLISLRPSGLVGQR